MINLSDSFNVITGQPIMTAPSFYVPQIFLHVAVLPVMIYVGLTADLFVWKCSGPASGSHCWQRSEALGTWHGHRRNHHTADF